MSTSGTSAEVAFERPDMDIEAELPVVPVGWRVLVKPYDPPTQSAGGIVYDDQTRESEEYLTYVGQIVAMGSECYKAITRTGIDMSNIDPRPKVGDWIIYGTYGGQKVRMKNGQKYLLMNDDGIMGVVADPHLFSAYL